MAEADGGDYGWTAGNEEAVTDRWEKGDQYTRRDLEGDLQW